MPTTLTELSIAATIVFIAPMAYGIIIGQFTSVMSDMSK